MKTLQKIIEILGFLIGCYSLCLAGKYEIAGQDTKAIYELIWGVILLK